MPRKTPPKKPGVGALGYSIGLDGLPTDPQHPWNADTRAREECISQYMSETLGVCERAWMRAGMLPALADAMMICYEFNRPLPKWVTLAAVAALRHLYVQIVVKGAGRHAHLKTRDRQNAVHYVRWNTVTELRERKKELEEIGYKPTWEEAYINASDKLKGTLAQGTPGAVKDSYQRVARDIKRGPEHCAKYYVAVYSGLTK